MTSYALMEASELRGELDAARNRLVSQSREMCDALEAGDIVWAAGVCVAVKATCHQIESLRRLLKVEVAG